MNEDIHSGHTHGSSREADRRYLSLALALIVAFMVVEIVIALIAGSVALLADAGHMLTDALALAASLWAVRLALRPAKGQWSFGFQRAEILSAAVNGVTLLVAGAAIGIESIRRLVSGPTVEGGAVLAVAVAGIAVNLLAAWCLRRANRSSLNVAGSYAHIVTDLFAFIGTAVAGLVIVLTGFDRADPIASLVVVALMFRAAWGLLRDSGRILLEGAPKSVDLAGVREHLLEADHVIDVHDLHAWTVTSDLPALSAHVVVERGCFDDGHAPRILDELQACLIGHWDVEHSTFQLEPDGHADHEAGAHA
jgi:cobalt-zinc-cadmium efflux system protein